MRTFTDDQDRKWTLAITVAALKRVRSLVPGVDLLALDAGEPPLSARLTVDPCLVCDVLFALIQPQAVEKQVSDLNFGEGLGTSLPKALQAFWGELIDFFQNLDRRDLARLATLQLQVLLEIVEHNQAAIERFEKERSHPPSPPPPTNPPTVGSSSTASPESSASTRIPSP